MILVKNYLPSLLIFMNLLMLNKLFANVVKLFHLEIIIKLQILKDIQRVKIVIFFVNNQPCIKTQQYFSCENLVGGDITIHIIPQDVVYFLGIQSYSNLNSNLILLDNESFFIYNYFNMPNTQNLLSRIFN